jgi:diaminohydroxyphosphoribosylaminopyrimidine deaminase / 5-amino-6-(5-phosphoribosylamino)uracil reductase
MGSVTQAGANPSEETRWMAAAIALCARVRALTGPNPNVGCVIVRARRVIGRGWTQFGGRPHAEAMAIAEAMSGGGDAKGATAYVTLEPCAHQSARGPACADSLIKAGIARVVVALKDPDPRTHGAGLAQLKAAGIAVETGVLASEASAAMAGWLMLRERGRPFITLKLATSLDGCIARTNGESQWITGAPARAHAHLERARSSMILVGRGTLDADAPTLDVRLPGLESRTPARLVLTHGAAPGGWQALAAPEQVYQLNAGDYLLVEGGAQTAASFLKAGLVDRILLYRAPILIGAGLAALGDIGLDTLAAAHGRWRQTDRRTLGSDTLEVYDACLK